MAHAQVRAWPEASGLGRLRHKAAAMARASSAYSSFRRSRQNSSVSLTTASKVARMGLGTDVGRSGHAMPDLVPGGARRRAGSGRGDGAGGLPGPGQEIADPLGGMVGQPRQHVGEPGLRVDAIQLCALRRCTGSVGASPTRQLSLQPEAPGADQEVTNGLKHLGKRPLSGASGPCGPQRERTPSRPRKCPMWEPTHQLNGEGRRRRASERDTPPPIPPGEGWQHAWRRTGAQPGKSARATTGGSRLVDGEPARASAGRGRWRRGPYDRGRRVMPAEERDPDLRQARNMARSRGLAQALTTPLDRVRRLQTSLQAKAKAEPTSRFYTLWGKVCREDVLSEA